MRDWLIAKRKSKKLSQKTMAELTGISQPSYCNIEKGRRNPAVSTAQKIGNILNFDWTLFYKNAS